MATRAFIIAIENYTQMQEGLNSTLPDTHKHALGFRQWLIDKQQLALGDIFFCTDDPKLEGRTADATRSAIKQELKRFKDVARDTTGDLFFYFSGHGFCYVDIDDLPTADVLLASDYVKRDESGDACLKLDEIQRWLKFSLGSVTAPGSTRCGHFYFIDACRNTISARDIKVADLGLAHEPSVRKKAPVYTLWSTTTGAVANVAGGFPEALLDGLNADGPLLTTPEHDDLGLVGGIPQAEVVVDRRQVLCRLAINRNEDVADLQTGRVGRTAGRHIRHDDAVVPLQAQPLCHRLRDRLDAHADFLPTQLAELFQLAERGSRRRARNREPEPVAPA